jgi:hypothetical protein
MTVILLFGMSAARGDGQTGRWASSRDPDASIITALEDLWAHTACSSVPQALKAAFAEDFQGTAPSGQRYGRPKHWGGRGDNLGCKLEKIQIRMFGDSAAVAYGNESSVKKQKDGQLLKQCLVWTDTWLKRKGKWQIVAAQDNRATCQ